MCVTALFKLIKILASEVKQEATHYNTQLDSKSGTCVLNGACWIYGYLYVRVLPNKSQCLLPENLLSWDERNFDTQTP